MRTFLPPTEGSSSAGIAIVALAVVLTGCVDDLLEPTPARTALDKPIPAGELLQTGPRSRGIEDAFLRIEARLPGFGGLYLDRGQNIVAYVTDPSRASAARALIGQTFLYDPGRPGWLNRPDGSQPTIRIVQGEYSMSQLVAWQQVMWRAAKPSHEIWLADADEGRNRVRLGIGSTEAIPDIEALATANGVPLEALYFQEMEALPMAAAGVRDEVRPTLAGIQVSRDFDGTPSCTLGFNVRDAGGDRYFLTASHCGGHYTSGMLGISFYQPGDGSPSTPRVGETAHNPVWNTSGCDADADYCRDTDAATVEYDNGIGHAFSVAETSSIGTGSSAGSLTIGTSRSVIGTVSPAQGMVLYKTGRTTGTTTTSPDSLASGTCSAQLYTLGLGSDTVEVDCAYSAPMWAKEGDSGSPVYRRDGSDVKAAGIVIATDTTTATTYFNGWSQIESHLGLSLNPIAPLSVHIGGPTEVQDDESCAWNSAVFGGRSPFTYSWSGVLSGSGPSVFGTVTSSGPLEIEVESDDGQVANDSIYVTVSPSAPACVEFAPSGRQDRRTSPAESP